MLNDNYFTIKSSVEARLTTQRSRFLAFAVPIKSIEEAESKAKEYKMKLFYDATHVCYAYALGINGDTYRAQDDGEPAGSAGLPIYRAIQSAQISDVLVIVVRYFGGIKLGVSGLIKAYGECAELALQAASKEEVILHEKLKVAFPPHLTGIVMNLINKNGGNIESQAYENEKIVLTLNIRKSSCATLQKKLSEIFGVSQEIMLPLQSNQK